jgi:NADH:ubiquinone reductase (H+-translocating)
MTSESSDLHRIIVVGGGAGGLELVTRLGDKLGRRKVADVTLIDKSRTHLWKPLLHEVAAGTMDFAVHDLPCSSKPEKPFPKLLAGSVQV